MVSYRVAIRPARFAGSEPSAAILTGSVGLCRTGSPTMRMGTTAMVGKLKRRLAGSGSGATVLGVVQYSPVHAPLKSSHSSNSESAGRVQGKRYGQRHGAGKSSGGRLRYRRWADTPRTR